MKSDPVNQVSERPPLAGSAVAAGFAAVLCWPPPAPFPALFLALSL